MILFHIINSYCSVQLSFFPVQIKAFQSVSCILFPAVVIFRMKDLLVESFLQSLNRSLLSLKNVQEMLNPTNGHVGISEVQRIQTNGCNKSHLTRSALRVGGYGMISGAVVRLTIGSRLLIGFHRLRFSEEVIMRLRTRHEIVVVVRCIDRTL